ncbi:MAG: hybrid sensor histidine kinase/response regulator [Myxococcaceae bacterium]
MIERGRVLHIEDEPGERAKVRTTLDATGLGYELREAADIEAGLAMLRQGGIDAVLLDYHLPGGDAFDVLAGVRVEGWTVPVILLSRVEDTALAVALMKAGAVDFVPKGQLTPLRLRQALQSAVKLSAAERRAELAKAERGRLIQQLSGLLEASVAIHKYKSIEETLAGCSAEAVKVLQADGASTVWSYKGVSSGDRCGRERLPGDLVIQASLPRVHGGEEGQLTVWRTGPGFDGTDQLAVVWLAQAVAVALDSTQLVLSSERATRLREDVLAIVSHDLRSPVQTVQAAAEELKHGFPGAGGLADLLLRASARMQRMLDDLLDAAQIDGGTLKVSPEPQSLARLLDDARAGVDPRRVVQFAPVPADVQVLADRERILQVFSNLIGNALKFTPRDGKVSVDVECVPGQANIRVRDTGPGVPHDHRARLFERMWSGQQKQGSTGLGLYISHAVMKAHQQDLALEDSVRGATFKFSLALV